MFLRTNDYSFASGLGLKFFWGKSTIWQFYDFATKKASTFLHMALKNVFSY